MYMILRYQNQTGRRVEAVLLATGSNTMRIVVRGQRDTSELMLVNGRWFNESGAALEIESMIPLTAAEASSFAMEAAPRVLASARAIGTV